MIQLKPSCSCLIFRHFEPRNFFFFFSFPERFLEQPKKSNFFWWCFGLLRGCRTKTLNFTSRASGNRVSNSKREGTVWRSRSSWRRKRRQTRLQKRRREEKRDSNGAEGKRKESHSKKRFQSLFVFLLFRLKVPL